MSRLKGCRDWVTFAVSEYWSTVLITAIIAIPIGLGAAHDLKKTQEAEQEFRRECVANGGMLTVTAENDSPTFPEDVTHARCSTGPEAP